MSQTQQRQQQQQQQQQQPEATQQSGGAAGAVTVISPLPMTGDTIHTLCTSNGSPYLNFQLRIMCAPPPPLKWWPTNMRDCGPPGEMQMGKHR